MLKKKIWLRCTPLAQKLMQGAHWPGQLFVHNYGCRRDFKTFNTVLLCPDRFKHNGGNGGILYFIWGVFFPQSLNGLGELKINIGEEMWGEWVVREVQLCWWIQLLFLSFSLTADSHRGVISQRSLCKILLLLQKPLLSWLCLCLLLCLRTQNPPEELQGDFRALSTSTGPATGSA